MESKDKPMSTTELKLPRTPILFICIVVAFFAFYARLASNNYTAVDGGVRCLDVFFAGQPFIHGNNHMLYPYHIYVFNKALSSCGLTASDAIQYFHLSIFLNAAAAAMALGVLFLIMLDLGISDKLSVLGVTLLAFSDSFAINATNPNEPMAGLCLSAIAVWLSLVADRRRSFFLSCLSGCVFAYAMATYQSMIFWLPAVLAVYVFKLWKEKDNKLSCFILLGAVVSAFLISTIVIYGYAYDRFYHISGFSRCFARFLQADGFGHGAWGKFSLINFPMLFPGLVQAFFHLPFAGLRQTFLDPASVKLWILPFVVVAVLCAMLLFVIQRLIKQQDLNKWIWFMLLLFVMIPSVCPFYWTITYSKLWLQPLAAFAVLTAFSLSALNKVVANGQKRQWIIGFVIAFSAIMLTWNEVTVLLPNHHGTPEVDTIMSQIDMNVEDNSLVFTNWDAVGVTFSHLYPRSREIISLPALVIETRPSGLQKFMDAKIADAVKQGRHVYFLGVLDTARTDWDAFFKSQLGVDYDSFEKYRKASSCLVELHAKNQKAKIFMLKR